MRRSLLVAALALSAIAAGGWSLQAISLIRPSRSQLELVKTLRTLGDFHGSQASVQLDGRRYRTSCTQQWDSAERKFRVIVDPGLVTETGTRLAGDPLEEGEFELAGCPRPLLDWLSAELVHGASVHFLSAASRQGGRLDRIELRPRTLPISIEVAPATGLPVRIAFTASHLQGTSVVHYGPAR
jgi:hypothetical protein